MSWGPEHERNEQTYRTLKDEIDRSFPSGHFVAIGDGQVVADAATFDEIDARLDVLSHDRFRYLVVQAGAKKPDYVVILPLSYPTRGR